MVQFFTAGAYTLSTEAHVRGDVIYRLFKPKVQGYIDLIFCILFFLPWSDGFGFLWL